MAAGGVPQLLSLLDQPDTATQVEAAKALADVIRDYTNAASAVAAGVLPVSALCSTSLRRQLCPSRPQITARVAPGESHIDGISFDTLPLFLHRHWLHRAVVPVCSIEQWCLCVAGVCRTTAHSTLVRQCCKPKLQLLSRPWKIEYSKFLIL